jgi:adenine-specific DNA-methyltransferase
MFHTQPFEIIKQHYDAVLNKDKTTYRSSNDEPTPIGCVEEMISAIPRDFWNIPGLRAIDPCCGNGNFHAVVANNLRANGYDRDAVREALVFNDINDSRLDNVQSVFGTDARVTRNDFLETDDAAVYDLVVMNPPYAKIMENGQRASKNHGLSAKFIEKGLRVLKENGYIVAIVPDNWMSLSDRNTLCETLTGYQFVKLVIHTAKRWFPKVGSSFTWFVLRKQPGTLPFEVETPEGTCMVNSVQRPYIPLRYSNMIQSIFAKTVDNDSLQKYVVETSSDLHRYTKRDLISNEETSEFSHRLIHTPKQTVWASRPHKYQEGWKVFLSTTDKYNVFIDNCGMTQSIAFIRSKNKKDAGKVAGILCHPLYRFINNICRYGNFNNIRVLQRFPVCTTGDPYTEFGLTEEERNYIER